MIEYIKIYYHVIVYMVQVTIYIMDPELIRWIDSMVKKGIFRNRSHAIEEAIKLLRKEYEQKDEIVF